MTSAPSPRPVSALRARMIEDMTVRGFTEETRSNYIRDVRAFAPIGSCSVSGCRKKATIDRKSHLPLPKVALTEVNRRLIGFNAGALLGTRPK
jgi:hypothetical protein